MSCQRHHILVPMYLFWPAAYLATLAVSMVAFWWVILIGGNPLEIHNIGTFDRNGEMRHVFYPGELVDVRRNLCSRTDVGVEYFSALRSASGAVFPLSGGFTALQAGCRPATYGFIMPALPPGAYSYINSVRFQNNLVGRDEFTVFPPMKLEVAGS